MDSQETYLCSKCLDKKDRSEFNEFKNSDRQRPVTSHCKTCRREDYFTKRYSTVCNCCQKHRKLDANGSCRVCNKELGLRQCQSHCKRVLPLFLYFYSRSCICKDCLKLPKVVPT